MLRRILALMLMLMLAVPALAEEAPILVDRVNAPDKYADFAFAEDAELLEVVFPQMLDTDAILLRCGGETVLVDSCKKAYAKRIVDMCNQLGITRIDRVYNTHPHEDHIGGFREIIKEIEVGELWICYPEDCNDHMKLAVNAAKKAGIPVKTYADGDVFSLGGATVEVWKLDGKSTEMNDCSAQMKVTFGVRTMLLTADLEENGQKKMLELHGDALDADILKYPHHGIKVLEPAYQEAVSPLFMVITNNHRKTAGWKWITSGKAGVPYAYTVPDLVHLTTDGATWIVEKIPSAVKY